MLRDRLSSFSIVWRKREYRSFLIVMILTSLGTSASSPLIALYLVDHMHLALSVVGLFFAGMALPGFIIGLLIGRWSDGWHSRLPSMRAAAVWGGIGWLIFAFAPHPWIALATGPVFLCVTGVIMGQTFAALHDVMTRDAERYPGFINTTVRTGWSFGFVFGPLLGSGMAALVSFRAAFIATAFLFLLCLLPIYGLDIPVLSSRQSGESRRSAFRANLLLFLFAGLCALVLCGTAIKNTYLPIDVTAHLHGSVRVYGTIVAVSPVVELVVMPLSGVLAMKFPIGRLIVLGLVIATVEYLLLSASTAIWQLYATQAMDACVVAVVMGLGLTYAQALSPRQAGLVSGIFGSSYGVAIVVGNLIGSVSVPALGVPHVFYIPAALCAAALATFLAVDHVAGRRPVLQTADGESAAG